MNNIDEKMNSEANNLRKKLSRQEGWLSIVINVILFGIKYWAGVVSGSLALMADAWHTLSDSISSIFVLVSTRFSHKNPDKEHPFGHGRFELVASIFIGVLLVVIALSFIREGIEKYVDKGSANYGWIAIGATVLSVLMKEGLAQFAFWGHRRTESDILRADGWHHRSDALSSIVILIGIFIGRYVWWIDAALSVVVAFFLFYAAYDIIKNSISVIIGESATPEFEQKVRDVAYSSVDKDIFLHHFHLHNYIVHKEITFHIRLPKDLTIEKAYSITKKIEVDLREKLDIESTIHVDPLTTNDK
ncbi:MAG: cation diffusion facilitator family transporter [Prolixibacteraceae bacterium]|nr:cation diffusion facilitator family transporter [Prolixibacteraceae bacterium]